MNSWCDSSVGVNYQQSKICSRLLESEHSKRRGYVINQYRSGEMTGAIFQTGYESCFPPPTRHGAIETSCLTPSAKTKIRRSIQCADVDFRCFMTVTFDPAQSQLTESGVVDQTWAKEKFKRFIHAIKVSYDRRAAITGDNSNKIAYVWVAELQASGNIHFHVMVNHRLPIAWLTKLWGQSKNSIDVRKVQNKNHASCYLRKYISKDESIISGNRYGISQNLRETMKPKKTTITEMEQVKSVRELIEAISQDIEREGGRVIDFGFHLPAPERPVKYRKNGKIRKTKGVTSMTHEFIMSECLDIVDPIPF